MNQSNCFVEVCPQHYIAAQLNLTDIYMNFVCFKTLISVELLLYLLSSLFQSQKANSIPQSTKKKSHLSWSYLIWEILKFKMWCEFILIFEKTIL